MVSLTMFATTAHRALAPLQHTHGEQRHMYATPFSLQAAGANSAESLASSLERALSQGQNDKARDILRQILKCHAVDPDLCLRIGVQFAQRELYAEAQEAFARCIRDSPGIFEAHYNLALTEFAQQNFTQALAALNDTPHGLASQNLAILYLRGKIESGLGTTAEAERDLSAAFSGAPQEENYALDLGLFYLRQRAYPRAEEIFDRGVRFNPRSPFLVLGLSLAQFLDGRNSESLESAKSILGFQADFSPALYLIAFVSYMDGKLEEAARAASQGLGMSHPPAYLYYLDAAILLKRQSHDYQRILNELAIAERSIPACSLCYLTASKAHQALGNVGAAIADLETAARLAPEFPEAWFRLAPLYERVGQRTRAVRAREQFQKLKAGKENREAEMLRNAFIQTLGSSESYAPNR